MATLILSTVGTALGGPVGAAIGALIGQSIDQQILGPAARGPRLGDLSVQTSSYGTPVPRIYGRMRVAGSVVWATDLSEGTETTGAKGQPATTFSYSVSFAVALSSRPILAIGRIWADGKLIRGADGVFSIPTIMRMHDGSEGQEVDPLIASIEGIGNAPGYRGLALAVFEDMALADFGNRIPFLTFEVIADENDPGLDLILADSARGAILAASSETVIGYAAYGQSMRSAAAPLAEAFGLELFDDGAVLRSPPSLAALAVTDSDLGNGADNERVSRSQREQGAIRTVPAALRLAYYDPERDFQSGETRASAGEQGGGERSLELPAVVGAAQAKEIVHRCLARSWAQRDRLTLRLPPRFLGLEPGLRVAVPLSPAEWTVESCTIEGFVVAAELRPATSPTVSLAAQGGRIATNTSDAEQPLTLGLFEGPYDGSTDGDATLLLAASSPGGRWRQRPVVVTVAGQSFTYSTPRIRSLLGRALETLPPATADVIDFASSVEIELVNHDQWLTSCDDDSLFNGANLSMIGNELIQFGEAVATGTGRFRLSRLLRGRGGTEWAIGGHQSNEAFALLGDGRTVTLRLPQWVKGATATAAPASGSGEAVSALAGGEALRPLAPVHLAGAFDGSGSLSLSWIRRSRKGWAWLDEVDVPLGEAGEHYRVSVIGSAGVVEATCLVSQITLSAAELAALGPGPAVVEVRQIGDFAASRPASISFILS